ncbi:MAG: hypothetical protein NTW87_10990 [Planctomycetota bacterium]|nr:hypothetical protein [Planctomycetota bacterium]
MIETLTKASMGVLLAASVPMTGDPGLWAQWGLAGIVVGYTLWRDWQRERRMSEALEKHQTWVQQTLVCALERSTKAMERIASRPCIAEKKEA